MSSTKMRRLLLSKPAAGTGRARPLPLLDRDQYHVVNSADELDDEDDEGPRDGEDSMVALTEEAGGVRHRRIHQVNADMYAAALQRFPTEADIDPAAEKKLKRKLDARILPVLGICYFFYYVDKVRCPPLHSMMFDVLILDVRRRSATPPSSASRRTSASAATSTAG
jgi:hypothetical protein